jgi:alkaline phosphatase
MRFLLFAVFVLLTGCATPPAPLSSLPFDRANNVIFMVGAGMGINTLTAARIYSVGDEGSLAIDTLPESAFIKTFSNDAQATDSAAAMAAYLTGFKSNNGGASGPACGATELTGLARAQGRAIGLVTTGRRLDAAYPCSAGASSHFDVVMEGGQAGVAAMTKAAIGALAQQPQGFFLVVQDTDIDRALRTSHGRRALQATEAFNDALAGAIAQMQVRDPGLKHTLIVATADHDNTMLINGYSPRTGKTTGANPGILGLVRNVTDHQLRRDLDGMPYAILGVGNGEHRVNGSRASAPALTDAATSADDYQQEAAIRMPPGSATSSGNDVYLGAIGAGAETFYGTIDNTRVFGLIKAAAGW